MTHSKSSILSRQTRTFHSSRITSQDAVAPVPDSSDYATQSRQSTLEVSNQHIQPATNSITDVIEPNFTSEDDADENSNWRTQPSERPANYPPKFRRRLPKPAQANVPKTADPTEQPLKNQPEWGVMKEAMRKKFPDGWKPRKRLSPDALAGIRALNAQFPEVYNIPTLAQKFELSPEAIRRILRSKWQPTLEEEQDRQERWTRRGMAVWERKAALGVKPPQRWRRMGITRDPDYHEWSKKASQRDQDFKDKQVQVYRDHLDKKKAGA